MNNRGKSIVMLMTLIVCGCAYLRYAEELRTLKSAGDSQDEIEEYLETQETLFYKLKDDVVNDRISAGIQKSEIIEAYGDPVLSKTILDKTSRHEVLLYRHPTHYFSSDRIYLYFDNNQNLIYWEFKPRQ